jgi:hypothetical protein
MSAAQEHNLVPYVDPYKSKRDLAVLAQPIRPTMSDIQPPTALRPNQTPQPGSMHSSNTQGTATPGESSTNSDAIPTYKDLNKAERAQLHLETQIYLHELKSYKEHSKAIGRLRTKVIETTHPDNFHYILGKESVYNMLVSLKNRFAASDYARKQEYTMEWKKTCIAPKRGTEIDHWLQKLKTLYNECKQLDIPDVADQWPLHAFLAAIHPISSSFSDSWQIKVINGDRPNFQELVQKYREYRSITSIRPKAGASHGAFKATQASTSKGAFEATLNGQNKDGDKSKTIKECLCGEVHRFIDCPYLFTEVRKSGWNPKPEVEKKVKEALAKASDGIKRALERAKAKLEKKNSTSTSIPGSPPATTNRPSNFVVQHCSRPGNFMLTHKTRPTFTPKHQLLGTQAKPTDLSMVLESLDTDPDSLKIRTQSVISPKSPESSAFRVTSANTNQQYMLNKSFILDSGATCHVCNDKSRFTNFRLAIEDDELYAGESVIPIKGFGTVLVTVTTSESKQYTLYLHNVVLISSFHTSVASLRLFMAQGVHWDTENLQLTYAKGTRNFCQTPMIHDQFVIEYRPLENNTAFATTGASVTPKEPIPGYKSQVEEVPDLQIESVAMRAHKSTDPPTPKRASFQEWHEMMGHPNPKALCHLVKAATGVEFTTKQLDYLIYERCELTNAKEQISKAPRERSNRPFDTVSWDVMFIKVGIGGEKRVLHAVDDCTRIHFVFTLFDDKHESLIKCLKAIAAYVFRQYGLIIRTWRHDSLPTLIASTRYDDWTWEEGYTVEISAPHTQAQNGGPERAGGVIALKATSLLGDSKLPEKLWPEAVITAGYLLNRTPTRALDWKTPFQFLYAWLKLPEPRVALHHLVPFGSKAFVHIKQRPKLDKTLDRAFIGWHCGYDSTNIYRVWVPSQHRIISVRDVTFDPSQRYRPNEAVDPQIKEIITLYEVPNIDDSEGHVEGLPIQWPLQLFESTLETYGDTITVDTPQLDTIVAKHTITGPGIGGLLSPNLTPEPEGQIPTQMSDPGLATNNDSPVLITGPAQIDALDAEIPTTNTPVFETRSTAIGSSIGRSKKPKKVTKSKGYYILEEGEERDTSKIISRDLLPGNIIEGKRSTRRGTALLAYQHLDQEAGYCAAFMTGTNHNPRRFHRSKLPLPPKNARQLETHPHKEGFILAAQKEYDSLLAKGTFEEMAIKDTNNAYIIPNMWVYTYKFDTDGFLERYKARLVIRGDLTRSIYEDTYAATLASRVFQCLIAIAAFFGLELY